MDKVKNTVLKRNIASNMETAVAIKIAGNVVDYDNSSCGKILLIISNTGSAPKKATIVKGNSLQGTEDLEVSVTNGKTMALVVESGKFVNVSGENKGNLVIKAEDDTSLKIQVVELP